MTDEPMSDQPSCSEAAFEQEAQSIERTALVRFAYHLWRVDTAARSFPHHLPDQMEIMRARWYIGLILEVTSFRYVIGDVCMLGYMSSNLSMDMSQRLQWLRIDTCFFPPEIRWDFLPHNNRGPPPVPCPPWVFGSPPIYLQAQMHWWENPDTDEMKPQWWNDPIKEKWLNEVRAPRDLIGRYVGALQDSAKVLSKARKILEHVANGEEVDVESGEY
ncbi:hypothetical protein QCA50_016969 [Cerrena zonata]|uniref:Uncharacterized protein n=1 Tax=Cerrena zonata TaxID=2478898 RepID=A0AAW0FG89_9APHY